MVTPTWGTGPPGGTGGAGQEHEHTLGVLVWHCHIGNGNWQYLWVTPRLDSYSLLFGKWTDFTRLKSDVYAVFYIVIHTFTIHVSALWRVFQTSISLHTCKQACDKSSVWIELIKKSAETMCVTGIKSTVIHLFLLFFLFNFLVQLFFLGSVGRITMKDMQVFPWG